MLELPVTVRPPLLRQRTALATAVHAVAALAASTLSASAWASPIESSASAQPAYASHAVAMPGMHNAKAIFLAAGASDKTDKHKDTSKDRSASSSSSVSAPPLSSDMDAEMFLQLMVAEMQVHSGDPGAAYQIYLEFAKRYKSGQLYQRAVAIALQARAGELALTAAKSWRHALPQSREACEYTVQILLALDRWADLAAPLRGLVQLSPAPQQPQILLTLPRMTARLTDKSAAAQVVDDATQPWRQAPLELPEAWIATAQAWTQAKDTDRALQALNKASALKPDHVMVGLLATDLMANTPQAERLITDQLALPQPNPLVRMAYARRLATSQRLTEAGQQLDQLTQTSPDNATVWLTLGLVRHELKQYDLADKALLRVLELHGQTERVSSTGKITTAAVHPATPAKADKPATPAKDAASAPPSSAEADAPPAAEDTPSSATTQSQNELEQAHLLLAQIAEKQGRMEQAIGWLQLADPSSHKLSIQNQKARLLARIGKLESARAAIRSVPESEQQDAIAKVQVEAQLLREANHLSEAQKVLSAAIERYPSEPDLMYDLAMVLEKLKHYERMEALLKKVMELSPDDPNAYNALGYSLVDRNVRLNEARPLLEKALALRPADPFITDSMAWLEYRSGQSSQAIKLLRQALQSRPDPEIAAHLGEILWATGQRDEARTIFKDALKRDPSNDVIKDVLSRLRVDL